jgi:hypothetical protein
VFTKHRDWLLTTDMSRKVLGAILAHPEVKPLLSDEHFSIDGTLAKAWASMKSFQPKDSAPPDQNHGLGDPPLPPPAKEISADTDHQPQQTAIQPIPDTPRQTRNAEVNFRGEKRSNATHASVTDPDARLYKKATLCFMGHTLMENRNGFVVQADLTHRRPRRAQGGPGDDQPALTWLDPAPDAGSRQGIRQPRLCRRSPAHGLINSPRSARRRGLSLEASAPRDPPVRRLTVDGQDKRSECRCSLEAFSQPPMRRTTDGVPATNKRWVARCHAQNEFLIKITSRCL